MVKVKCTKIKVKRAQGNTFEIAGYLHASGTPRSREICMHKLVSRRVECAHASFQARTDGWVGDPRSRLGGRTVASSTRLAAATSARARRASVSWSTGLADFEDFSPNLKVF